MNRFIDIEYATKLQQTINIDDYVESLIERLKIIHEEAKQNIANNQLKSQTFFNRNKQIINFDVGSKVLLYNRHRKIGENPKFYRNYIGPFIVERNEGNNRYLLKCCKTNKIMKHTVNGNSLKKLKVNFEDNNDEYTTRHTQIPKTTSKTITDIIDSSNTKPLRYLVRYDDNGTEWKDKHTIPQTLVDKFNTKHRTMQTRSMTSYN